MLKLRAKKLHRVLEGQTLEQIAATYKIPARLLVKENGLTGEVYEGQILFLPERKGDLYTVQAGDDKRLLCGTEKNYENKNGTKILYPEMKVWI